MDNNTGKHSASQKLSGLGQNNPTAMEGKGAEQSFSRRDGKKHLLIH